MCHRVQMKCFLVLVFFVGVAFRTTYAFVPSLSRTTLATGASLSNGIQHDRLSTTTVLREFPPDEDINDTSNGEGKDDSLGSEVRRALLASSLAALTYNIITLGIPAIGRLNNPGYEKVSPLQFVAALGDPDASSGSGAENWGLWSTDPGPRGLRLREYVRIVESQESGSSRPSWLDDTDFFLDENAIIMPMPEFPLPPGKYLVTGARAVTTGLTIDSEGNWKLDDGKLYDVTHLPCRAARYQRAQGEDGSPLTVQKGDFPVVPGGIMPDVPGTDKQIHSVLFIIGKQSV